MKNKSIYIISLLLFSIISLSSCNNNTVNTEYTVDPSDIINGDELVVNTTIPTLTEEEISGLILMREEEKLARDVYLTLFNKWNLPIFNNIAKSEQTHTNAIKVLLDRYDIEDPVKDDSNGKFTSPVLSELYVSLVSEGEKTLLDALIVGATVEDLDIKDLSGLLENTENQDIINTYKNLSKGSRNHLRAFISQIKNQGGEYSPNYMSESEFDDIISSKQEKGRAK